MQFIKIDLEHNLSSLKIPEVKVDPYQTVLALKQNIERRYGSQPPYVKLTLKSKKGQVLAQMNQDLRTLKFYGIETGMIVSVMDLNPNSIHKEIQNVNEIQKYVMSQQAYDQLSQNFRKWKANFLQEHPQVKNPQGKIEICDPQYLSCMAQEMQAGMRCQLQNGQRGQIRYVGKVPELGLGYFVGILLDQSSPDATSGVMPSGNYYFYAQQGKGMFLRPNKIQVGEFPKIQQNDEI